MDAFTFPEQFQGMSEPEWLGLAKSAYRLEHGGPRVGRPTTSKDLYAKALNAELQTQGRGRKGKVTK